MKNSRDLILGEVVFINHLSYPGFLTLLIEWLRFLVKTENNLRRERFIPHRSEKNWELKNEKTFSGWR